MSLILTKWLRYREPGRDKIDLFIANAPCVVLSTVMRNERRLANSGADVIDIHPLAMMGTEGKRRVPLIHKFTTEREFTNWLSILSEIIIGRSETTIFIRNIGDVIDQYNIHHEDPDDTISAIRRRKMIIEKFVTSFPNKTLILLLNVDEESSTPWLEKSIHFDEIVEAWQPSIWELIDVKKW